MNRLELMVALCSGVVLLQMALFEMNRRHDMADLTTALARLKDDVTKNRGLISSIVQQNTGFAQMLRDLAAKDTTGDNVAAELSDFADQLEGDALSMATAISAGTSIVIVPPADTTPAITVPTIPTGTPPVDVVGAVAPVTTPQGEPTPDVNTAPASQTPAEQAFNPDNKS